MGQPESIVLTAQDGVRIAGASLNADQPRAAALLLHMMPATKESWSAFAFRLSERGVASLAIDLRGHGDSTNGPAGALDYRTFSDAEHQAARLDVEAALDWLSARYHGRPLLIAGASIGANLAIRAMAEHANLRAGLALSPSLEYRGVKTEDAVARLRQDQRLRLVASEEDAYSLSGVKRLAQEKTQGKIESDLLESAGHGTAILERDPAFAERALEWLSSAV